MTVHVAGRVVPTDPRVAVRAVGSEVRSLPRSLRLWLGFLLVLLVIGAAGAIRCLFPGDKALGTTPTFEWGLLIIGYVFFAITTSGLCLASSLGTVFGIERFKPLEKRHAVLAILCLTTAFGTIALDLHYPIRLVFGAVFNPSPTSPMWWMGVFYAIYFCFLLTEVWSMFTERPRLHQVACVLASCMAIFAPLTLGAVFAVIAARAAWYDPFTPVLMVSSALLSGTSVLAIVFYFVYRLRLAGWERAGRLAIPAIRLLLAVAIVLVSVLVARQVFAGLVTDDPSLKAATQAIVAGPLATLFWLPRVGLGLLVPFVLIVLPATRTPLGLLAAGVLALLGVFVDRTTFVASGQIAPVTATSGVVSAPYANYTPSPVEVSILVGGVAFVAFMYTLAERYLPLGESDFQLGLHNWIKWPNRWRWVTAGASGLASAGTLEAGALDSAVEPPSGGLDWPRASSEGGPDQAATALPGGVEAVSEVPAPVAAEVSRDGAPEEVSEPAVERALASEPDAALEPQVARQADAALETAAALEPEVALDADAPEPVEPGGERDGSAGGDDAS